MNITQVNRTLANAYLIAAAPAMIEMLNEGASIPIFRAMALTDEPIDFASTLEMISRDIRHTGAGPAWSDWLNEKARSIRSVIEKATNGPKVSG